MRFGKSLLLVGLLAALAAPAGAALARDKHDDRGRGHDRHGHYDRRDRGDDRVYVYRPAPPVVVVRPEPRRAYNRGYERGFDDGVRFADRDRGYVHRWYDRYPSYYRPMPPGHYRRLARGGYLPPGYYALPPMMVREMRPLPRGYGYYAVDRDVVIAELATGLILDVLLGNN